MVAAVKGYKLILVMPDSMSLERRRLMLAYGASFELTPREKGMKGAIARAEELVGQTPGAWMPQQFDNPANVDVHAPHHRAGDPGTTSRTAIDALITGVGTGGHITGCAQVLKTAVAAAEGLRGRAHGYRRSSRAARTRRTRSRASAPASSRATCTPRCSTA